MTHPDDDAEKAASQFAEHWVHAICIQGIFPRRDQGERGAQEGFIAGQRHERERILNIVHLAAAYVGGPVDQITIGLQYLLDEINGKKEGQE